MANFYGEDEHRGQVVYDANHDPGKEYRMAQLGNRFSEAFDDAIAKQDADQLRKTIAALEKRQSISEAAILEVVRRISSRFDDLEKSRTKSAPSRNPLEALPGWRAAHAQMLANQARRR